MGEARRRAAIACPALACRSRDVVDVPPAGELAAAIAKAWGFGPDRAVPLRLCRSCGALWEPLPPGWSDDCVERRPCDNCAFRRGSPETEDPGKRAWLHGLAEEAAAVGPCGPARPWFACHKGIPIRLGDGGISFDFEAAGIDPLERSCAGFLRVLWARNGARAGRRAEGTGKVPEADAPVAGAAGGGRAGMAGRRPTREARG